MRHSLLAPPVLVNLPSLSSCWAYSLRVSKDNMDLDVHEGRTIWESARTTYTVDHLDARKQMDAHSGRQPGRYEQWILMRKGWTYIYEPQRGGGGQVTLDEQDIRYLESEWVRENIMGLGQAVSGGGVILDGSSVCENIAITAADGAGEVTREHD